MPSNYTGNPIATQSPSPAPSFGSTTGGDPVGSLPVNGDPPDASAWAQGFKVALDWSAFFRRQMSPGAQVVGTFAVSSGAVSDVYQFTIGIVKVLLFHLWNVPESPGYSNISLTDSAAFPTGIKNVQLCNNVATGTTVGASITSANAIQVVYSGDNPTGPYDTYIVLLGI